MKSSKVIYSFLALAFGFFGLNAGPWKTEIIVKNSSNDILYVFETPIRIDPSKRAAYGTVRAEIGPGGRETLDFINRRGFFGTDENSNKVFMLKLKKGGVIYLFVKFENNQLHVGVGQKFEGPDEWHRVEKTGFLGLGGDAKRKVAIDFQGKIDHLGLPPIKISWWINSLLHDIEFEIK